MESYMGMIYIIGGIIVLAVVILLVGTSVTRVKAKNKSIRSLPKGSDETEFTQEFIRRYNTDD